MSAKTNEPFTEEQWLKFVQQKQLKFVECQDCHKMSVIPFAVCTTCGSRNITWKQASGQGSIYTYTITAVPPPELQAIAPYVAGVVELQEGLRINGIITGVENVNSYPADLVGKTVSIEFLELDRKSILAFRLNA
ncbi:MAG: hypothetical protein RBG13Loki_2981 [Promethearchaeota archaeon CR_4]|nr:MAG: hypothetical protein RBG13Loki_2981 [Candidatus Lokiarchaeota archaeon CR_4]